MSNFDSYAIWDTEEFFGDFRNPQRILGSISVRRLRK